MPAKNFSGRPNAGSCAAIFFHISMEGPSPFLTVMTGAWVLSPYAEASPWQPLVQMTRSFSVRSMTFSTPPCVYSIFFATFFSGVQSQTMFVTVVS